MLHWGRAAPLFAQEMRSYGWIPSKSMEIRFEQGDLLRILATNIRGKDRKDYRTGDVMYVLILLLWEQLWDCNLVSTECS